MVTKFTMRCAKCDDSLPYDAGYIDREAHKVSHETILATLTHLKAKGKITDFKSLEDNQAFPTEEEKKAFLEKLADFSLIHHVGLARIFGSRKYGFSYIPIQFITVYGDSEIKEVFSCKIGREPSRNNGILTSLGQRRTMD